MSVHWEPPDKWKKRHKCADKIPFLNMLAARRAADDYRADFGDRMNAYRCVQCLHFHIGHPKHK